MVGISKSLISIGADSSDVLTHTFALATAFGSDCNSAEAWDEIKFCIISALDKLSYITRDFIS